VLFHATTAVSIITGLRNYLGPFQYLLMLRIYRPIRCMTTIVVITLTIDTQNLTLQADWIGILMLGDEQIFYFVSAAKNTVAFFKISFSISSRLT
jgi:hypothetical protein